MSSSQQPALSRPAQAAAILRSLPGLAERLRSHLPPHRLEDLHEHFNLLVALCPLIDDSTAVPALLSNAAARDALLSVLAVALRQPLPCSIVGTQGGGGIRGDASAAGYHGIARVACVCYNTLLLCELPPLVAARRVGFARRLLRTQPLQCCARRLASVGAALLSFERGGEGPQEQTRRGAAGSNAARAQLARADDLELPKDARTAIVQAMSLIEGLTCVAAHADGEEEDASPQNELAQLRQELAAALRDSCVLEHAARALLLLFGCCLQRPDENGNDCAVAFGISHALDGIAELLPSGHLAAPTSSPVALAAALRGVISGRCVQHAVLVSGVVALCAADGGPSYGLPGELLQRVPLIGLRQVPAGTPAGFDLRLASGRQVLDFRALRCMVRALSSRDRVAPPGRHGALALLLRVGRRAVASGRSHLAAGRESGGQAAVGIAVRHERGSSGSGSGNGGGSNSSSGSGSGSGSGCSGNGGGSSASSSGRSSSRGSGSRGSGSSSGASSSRSSGSHGLRQEQAAALSRRPHAPSVPGLQLVLAQDILQPIFDDALEAAMALCFPAGPADRSQRAAARVECWRLFAEYTRGVLPLRRCDPLPASPVRHLTDPGRLRPGAPMPDSPPPSWEPALAGGWLPCLERLLRRGGEDPAGPELVLSSSALLLKESATVVDCPMAWRHLAVLLAYGEPRQAAALVATLGKLLRAADPACLAIGASSTGLATPAMAALWLLEGASMDVSTAAAAASDADGQARAGLPRGAPSAAGWQLARMVSYAMCEWLPPLARLAARAIQAAARCGAAGRQRSTRAAEDASRSAAVQTAVPLLLPLLAWLPALLHRCIITVGGAAAVGGGLAGAGGGGCGNGPADDGCGGWRQLVLEEVGTVQLLGAALHVFTAAAPADRPRSVLLRLVQTCCALTVAFPREVRAAVSDAARGQVPAHRELGEQAAGATPALGRSGAAVASQPRFPWRPRLLQALALSLRADGHGPNADSAEALAAVLQSWEVGGSVGAGDEAASTQAAAEAAEEAGAGVLLTAWRRVEEGSTSYVAEIQWLVPTLVPVAEARGVLRTCSHPGCVSLAGDSEAEAEAGLLVCGGCGAARYCCADCQAAHWRAGHERACVQRG
ncbi:hypothetical protein TSOC_010803 [Tetrabaena socialis]|uniref:phytol kinase n=1 Tax=Tetrabaena socialis TaxID=47790 RepID=A0A2J7ZSC2_9CHLO|nr:hypothetical protein TSOC_010803 [Tetrabaena socialis]|eukprot:PNH03167.1 hypothetical protein TSOC_010803 [Tetrabaena socialis]